jgi:hypothetical protein
VHFGIEAFWWLLAVKATLMGMNEILCLGWLPHQPSYTFDHVLSLVFDRVLVIVIPSHIVESVKFPIPNSLIIWHTSHELLDAIPISEAWETQSGVLILQHLVIVRLHAFLLDPTQHIFVLFTHHKRLVEIV